MSLDEPGGDEEGVGRLGETDEAWRAGKVESGWAVSSIGVSEIPPTQHGMSKRMTRRIMRDQALRGQPNPSLDRPSSPDY